VTVPIFDKVLIGGQWVPAANGTYQITNPATEEPAGYAPECAVEQVRGAAHAARAAFENGPWRTMSGAERGALLQEAADKFRAQMSGLVDLTIAETGAVRPVAISQQVGAVATRLAKYGELASAPTDEALPPRELQGPNARGLAAGLVVREPIGVVAGITPFNFPMTSCAGKIGAALACGNTIVVKPAPVDPLGVVELCRIVDSVLPPGVVNFVCGSGPDIGEALTTSPDVDMISFTGSTTVGRKIQESAAARMQRTLMELGGKSANIIFADADLTKALANAMQVWTFHSGQICIAGTRVLIEQSVYDEFTKRLAATGPTLRIGDPREAGVVATSHTASRRARRWRAAASARRICCAATMWSRRCLPTPPT
jgi:acyl-CoA reductase-like NAD-dependent aldehyde dehydrogenase